MAGSWYLVGAILQCTSFVKAQLLIGRLVLGFGVGLANQVAPLFLSEVAPPQYRGALNILYQWGVTLGILVAECINYGTYHVRPYGFRISLGLQGLPGLLLIIGGFFIAESPNYLIERRQYQKGKLTLQKIRGVEDVDLEYDHICEAAEVSQSIKHPWRDLFHPRNAAQATICIFIPFAQQFTGINVIMFYAPQVFSTLGATPLTALRNSIILGAVNCASTMVSSIFVDRLGRKILFLEAGIQMFIAQMVFGAVMGKYFKKLSTVPSAKLIDILLFLSCVFVSAYAWSWGPLTFLVPSEILTLQTRPAGQGLVVVSNFLWTFVVGQSFLSMLCGMKYGVYIFFALWVAIMTCFTQFLLPETRNVPLEQVPEKFKKHWFWKYTANWDQRHSKDSIASQAKKQENREKISSKI